MNEAVKKTLEKQMELLSERSDSVLLSAGELETLTGAMIRLATCIESLGYYEQGQLFRPEV